MEVYIVQVEYKGIKSSEDFVNYAVWSSFEGAKGALKQEREDILNDCNWSKDDIDYDEDDHFCISKGGYFAEFYDVTIEKQVVHD